MRDIIDESGYKVVQIYDYNSKNQIKMKDYIIDRIAEGLFRVNDRLEEGLLVGLGCQDSGAFEVNVRNHHDGDVMRILYEGMDVLLVRK